MRDGGRVALVAALLLVGCANLEPALPKAEPNIAQAWVLPEWTATPRTDPKPGKGENRGPSPGEPGSVPSEIGWRDFLLDERLETLVARALENNRDLRVAVLNVDRARALYRIQRSDRFPSVGGNVQMSRSGGDDVPSQEIYSAGIGVTGFELDLFGRVRNLSDAALREFFATQENRRATQLSLVAEVANAYLTLAADRELLNLSRATLTAFDKSFELTQKRFELGAVSRLDLAQSRTLVENARADAARFEGNVARDINALTLLVGGPVEDRLLPAGFGNTVQGLQAVPSGLPSEVLLRRPDVLAAEHRLRAANANIGAARAAFFPSISLTGSVGVASDSLSRLFSGGFAWSFLPQVNIPIFQAGRLGANLGVAKADRDIALAQYEKSIQQGFREVNDALALSGTLARQVEAQAAQLEAAQQAHDLSRERYQAGRDSYLGFLDAQRTLYGVQQALVATRLAEQSNRVTLYKVLGGGWKESS
ncbi:MAG TPA: efflux transporter outer membrane subunit [Usitatibacter sp.]|nr:efflux transporter outer membrane subunit [Usitatibacter sp.]